MNVAFLSEQNFEVVGGSVSYVKMILRYFPRANNSIYFIYPSIESENTLIDGVNFIGISIGVEWNEFLGWKYRYLFVNKVNKLLEELIPNKKIEIIHILHGFFLLEKLNYSFLALHKVKSIITIHNIPPKEGGSSWEGDQLFLYIKNQIFKTFRKVLFRYRLMKSKIDCFIVPSFNVYLEFTSIYRKRKECFVIQHGSILFSDKIISPVSKVKKERLSLLTVGGFAPHKNQLIIPKIASLLRQAEIDFEWDIIGPIRNSRYYLAIRSEIQKLNLVHNVHLRTDISDEALDQFYKRASIYIHTSFEEGFSFTVLDAAFYQLPIIGLNVGEIAPIIQRSYGIVVENKSSAFFEAIDKVRGDFVCTNDFSSFVKYYSWDSSLQKLNALYKNILSK